MTQNWTWTGRYIIAIIMALVLASVIGEMGLFKQATMGTPRLTAAGLVKFMGYAGALGLLWQLGQKTARQLLATGNKISFLGLILVPLVSLVIVSCAYSVLLLILRPFLDSDLQNIYNWVFVLAITACALWLVVAIFHHSEPLMDLFKLGSKSGSDMTHRKCSACGASPTGAATFCPGCGARV